MVDSSNITGRIQDYILESCIINIFSRSRYYCICIQVNQLILYQVLKQFVVLSSGGITSAKNSWCSAVRETNARKFLPSHALSWTCSLCPVNANVKVAIVSIMEISVWRTLAQSSIFLPIYFSFSSNNCRHSPILCRQQTRVNVCLIFYASVLYWKYYITILKLNLSIPFAYHNFELSDQQTASKLCKTAFSVILNNIANALGRGHVLMSTF